MTNSDLWKSYSTSTKDLSDITRKLGFAAVGIVWILKDTLTELPTLLLIALMSTVIFFLLDILQYFIGSIILKRWIEKEEKYKYEKTGSIDGKYEKPKSLDFPSYIFFILKTIILIISYVIIGLYIL